MLSVSLLIQVWATKNPIKSVGYQYFCYFLQFGFQDALRCGQDAPREAQDEPREAEAEPRSAPRWARIGLRWRQVAAKMAQDSAKTAPRRLRLSTFGSQSHATIKKSC